MSSINITTLKRLLWPSEVKMLLSIAIGVFAIVGLFKLYGYWDNYRDRPLAEGFTYVGRDYQPGCNLIFTCGMAYRNVLFYATDVGPEDAIRQFPGWSAEPIVDKDKWYGRSYQEQLENSLDSRACLMIFRKTVDNRQTTLDLCYTKKQSTTDDDYGRHNLKPIHKKYLVAINGDSYREVMENINEAGTF